MKPYFTKSRLFGDRHFYRRMLAVVLPIIVQNTVTNVVSLLDNVMVGQTGTLQMSAVAIINQLIFVYNLCIFGGLSGAGIFSAQYAGAKDDDGIRHCFRIKLAIGLFVFTAGALIFSLFGRPLAYSYLKNEADAAAAEQTLGYALNYLSIMLAGLLPFTLAQIYGSTLRECGETKLPMTASVAAILVNLIFNWILIFGNLGFPALGVAGAAIATVLSRFVELAILLVCVAVRKYPYLQGAFRSLRAPASLWKNVLIKGSPLLINELLWSSGLAVLGQCYSVRGLDVVAATNINSTVSNLFNVIFISMGSAVSIIVGQDLGAGREEDAIDSAWRLTLVSILSTLSVGCVLIAVSPYVPRIYNTSEHVYGLATRLLCASAVTMVFHSFSNCCYFVLRSGGKTFLTLLFDCVSIWVVSVPIAWLLTHLTSLGVVEIYFLVESANFAKCILGFFLVKRGIWINRMISD